MGSFLSSSSPPPLLLLLSSRVARVVRLYFKHADVPTNSGHIFKEDEDLEAHLDVPLELKLGGVEMKFENGKVII